MAVIAYIYFVVSLWQNGLKNSIELVFLAVHRQVAVHQNSLFSKSQRQINRTIGRIGSTVTIFVGTCVKEKMQVNKGTYKVKSRHLYCEMEKRIPLSIHTTSSSRMKMIFNSK